MVPRTLPAPRDPVRQWLESFRELPVRQKPASFNPDEVMLSLSETPGTGK